MNLATNASNFDHIPGAASAAPSPVGAPCGATPRPTSLRTNKSAKLVADWFGVTLDEVRAAVRFEQSHPRRPSSSEPCRVGARHRRSRPSNEKGPSTVAFTFTMVG